MEEGVNAPSSDETGFKTNTELLEYLCPYYMVYGMSYDEFWNSPTDRHAAYRQKHQYDREQKNQELWMLGGYIRRAIASCFSQEDEYPQQPIRITEMSEVEKAEQQKRDSEKLVQFLNEHKRQFDARQKAREAQRK